MSSLPPVERIDLRRIAPQPWKNGAGLTREIAVAPRHGGVAGEAAAAGEADFDWRISVAEVERDAAFSAFPGVDRCIVLLRGAGMRLTSRGASSIDHALDRPLVPFHFSGDAALSAMPYGGASSSNLNVMTRRGAWRCEVTCHERAGRLAGGGDATLLLCVAGEWWVDDAAADDRPLAPLQALLWRGADAMSGGIEVRPAGTGTGTGAALLEVRLLRLRRQDPAA